MSTSVEATPVAIPATSSFAAEHQKILLVQRFWKFSLIMASLMCVLALLGVGLTTTNSNLAPTYWVSLVPIFALLCVGTAYKRAALTAHGEQHLLDRTVVIRQLLHWVAIGVALFLDFYVRRTGEETGVAAGLNALLLLALGSFLAGVHFEWVFSLVGVFLAIVLLCVAKADQYLWLLFVIGGLAIACMLFAWWRIGVNASRKAAAISAGSPSAGS